jgi:membrane associated rhomboid family serine protease/Tfp pilus assembly protein PilF
MAVAITAMTGSGRWPMDRFDVGPTAFHGEPWRLLTSVLPHVNALHLLFNVYWLWVFGTLLEEVLGHARLLGLIVLFAAGPMAAEYAVFSGGVGLSGVGYGLFGLLWVLSSRDRRFAGAVDARTARLFVGWFFFCIGLTCLKIMAVANVAHAAGAALGVLVGFAMSARAPARRVLAGVGVPLVIGASLLGATVLRPRINLERDGAKSFALGYEAIQAGRFDDAIRHYRDSVAMNDRDASAWHNLGVAYSGAGRGEEAVAAYRRSYDIDRHGAQHRSAFVHASQRLALEVQERGDHDRALALLRELVALGLDDAATWLLIEQSHRSLGHAAEADEARDHAVKLLPRDGR